MILQYRQRMFRWRAEIASGIPRLWLEFQAPLTVGRVIYWIVIYLCLGAVAAGLVYLVHENTDTTG